MEGEGAQNWASACIGVQGWGGEARTRGRKRQVGSLTLLSTLPGFSRKENLMDEAGVGTYLEAGVQLTVCSCKCVFEAEALAIRSLIAVP